MRLKLAGFLTGDLGEPAPRLLTETTATGAVDANYPVTDRLWNILFDRRSVYRDLLDMDRNGSIVSTGLDIIASGTVCSDDPAFDGFEWELTTPDDGAQQVLDDMKKRLALGAEAWQIVRRFVCFGEEFCEIVVDDRGLVQGFHSLPSWTVMPSFDLLGNRLPGWTQRVERGLSRVIPFDEWQIVPFISGPKTGFFGRGLMLPARRAWARHEKLCDGMAIARLTRAYDRTVFKVPVKDSWAAPKQWEVIRLFKESLTKRRSLDAAGNLSLQNDPLTPSTEIFIPDDGTGRGSVETLAQQNMQLMNVEDLRYHQEEILCRLRVPKRYFNLAMKGQGVNAASIAAEDKQFAWFLIQNQGIFRAGMVTLGERALLLQGYDPAKLGVGVRMARVAVEDRLERAKVDFTEAQAAQLFSMTVLQGGMPPEILAERYMQLTPEEQRVMVAFQQAKQAELKAERQAAAAAAQAGRTSLPGAEKPEAQQVAEILARWGMLAQEEAERQGLPFSVGLVERRRRAMEAIWELGAGHENGA